MKKNYKFTVLVFVLVVVLFSTAATTAFASVGRENDFSKTVRWIDKDNGVASIALSSDIKANGANGRILFLGSMSSENGLDESLIKSAIDTCAQYADVDYHLFRTQNDMQPYNFSNSMNAKYPSVIEGTLTKMRTDDNGNYIGGFDISNVRCAENSYATIYDFAKIISRVLDPKSASYIPYDYVVMQFDGMRIGMHDAKINADSINAGNLQNAALIMRDLYSQNKVVWITCNKDSNYSEYNGLGMKSTYMFNDYYIANNNSSYSNNVYDSLALIAPEDWLNGDSRRLFENGTSDYPSDYEAFFSNEENLKTFRERTGGTSNNSIWTTYADEGKIADFIKIKITENSFDYVKITDVVKAGFVIKDVRGEVFVNDSQDSGYREIVNGNGVEINNWDNNNKKIVAKFDLNKLESSRVRLVIEIIVDKNHNPFRQDDLAYTNEGLATAEYGCNNLGVKTSREAKSPYLKKTAEKMRVVNHNTNFAEVIQNMDFDDFADYVKAEMLSF